MNCPNGCATPLSMTDRQGVEIDYCPTCRGVWLDRGELDKIIERSVAPSAPPPQAAPQAPYPPQGYGQQPHFGQFRTSAHLGQAEQTGFLHKSHIAR